ncbi:MAG TPA: DMT family transporter [Solirubrobacteraceae bacterium]|nr:DMT family transporter [Solirubrobacteraceae bacterium]
MPRSRASPPRCATPGCEPAASHRSAPVPSAEAIGALVALGLANTGIGFCLFYALIDRAGAGKASLITYVIPGVAALLGIGVLGEDFGANTALGLALILAGSWLASGGTGPVVESRSDRRS